MTIRTWISAVILAAAAMIAATAQSAPAQDAPEANGAAPAPGTYEQLAAALTASAPQTDRDEAARRLVLRQSDQARQILRSALVDVGNTGAQLAAARALIEDPAPHADFINPLFALIAADPPLAEAAARALGNFRNSADVLVRLANVATSSQNTPGARTVAVRALAAFPEKRAARVLISILTGENEPAVIRIAAGEALIEMTGLNQNGLDVQLWQRWWQLNEPRSDAEFKANLLDARAHRFDQLRWRQQRMRDELRAILEEQYRAADGRQRGDILLRYLRSPDSDIRNLGVRIVYEDFTSGVAVPETARLRLRTMVGDSSTPVRLEVARTLRVINDAGALEYILNQIPHESDAEVRAALAAALAPIRDIRALPVLIDLVQDESHRAAVAAMRAIEDLGPLVHEQNPSLAARAAEVLRPNLLSSAPPERREAALRAIAPLRVREPALIQLYNRMLGAHEPPAIRRGALRALGELRDPRVADAVANALEDPESTVRLEAVLALGKTGAVEHAEALFRRLSTAVEPDASIRQQAWGVLQTLFPRMPAEQLVNWADRFRNDPARRLVIQQALIARLERDDRGEPLAIQQQNIGQTLMELQRPAEAAEFFKLALDYWERQDVGMRIEGLIRQYTDALLRSRQYPLAIAFASEKITQDPAHQQTMGALIRGEAERLRDRREFDHAIALIEEAGRMSPPLDPQYRDALLLIERDVRRHLEQRDPRPEAAAIRDRRT